MFILPGILPAGHFKANQATVSEFGTQIEFSRRF